MPNLLHAEVCQNAESLLTECEIKKLLQTELPFSKEILNKLMLPEDFPSETLKTHIQSIYCSYNQETVKHINLEDKIKFHIYRLNEEDIATETIHKDGEEICAAAHWILPSKEFFGLWENLFYDLGVKEKLLNFVETAMIYSERKVNPHIISWNKVILLHGPPGTGKTSLCKALAQKITIRLEHQFNYCQLIEINSHSLFSKWFSESGKLVMNVFSEIKLLLQNPKALVFILIDEVESLAHTRKACTTGSEPSDSIRVVNALLTQLDNIKRFPNVLILTTSNLTEAIDIAFVDRADIKLCIPLPNKQAIYKIYCNCIEELMRTGFIQPEKICDLEYLKRLKFEENLETKNSLILHQLSCKSDKMSGRSLKKIPFLAHALYSEIKDCSLHEFLNAMNFAIQWQKENSL